MAIWKRAMDLRTLNERSKGTLGGFLDIIFFEIEDDSLLAKMKIEDKHKQPMGIMHGGTSCVIAETVGSTAANFCVDAGQYCVGLDINTNHIKSVRAGELIARAFPYHLGRSTQVWGIEIKTSHDELVSINRLTMAVLSREPRR